MKQVFSNAWKASKQPRKQRKYVAQAPDHIKSKMVQVSLSKDLREKHGTRSTRVRVGDTVKLLRGQFKGTMGKVESIDVENQRITVEKVEFEKKDGGKAKYPVHPSNAQITILDLSDKKRKAKLK